jgi:hypothetical protein
MGKGVPQSDADALQWLTPAAENNHAHSQMALAHIHLNGQGVPQDYTVAYIWSDIALANGRANAREIRDEAAAQMSPAELDHAQRQVEHWKQQHGLGAKH